MLHQINSLGKAFLHVCNPNPSNQPFSYPSSLYSTSIGVMGAASSLFLIRMYLVNDDRRLYQQARRNMDQLFPDETVEAYKHEFRSKQIDTQIERKISACAKAFLLTFGVTVAVGCLVNTGYADKSSNITYLPPAACLITTCGIAYTAYQSIQNGDASN